MRVLVVDPIFSSLPYDRALCGALAREGHKVAIVGRALRGYESWAVPDVELITFPIVDVIEKAPFSGRRLQLYSLWRHLLFGFQIQRLESIIDSFRPDIVHFQWCLTPLAEGILVAKLRRRAVILFTMHDTNPFNGTKVSSFVTRGLHNLMNRFDHLIVHTQSAADILAQRGFKRERLSVVPHGLLTSPAMPADDTMKSDAISRESITCLLFGHVKHYKGVDVLLRAVASISQETQKKIRIVIAGQLGVEPGELQRLAKEGGIENLVDFDLRFIPDVDVDRIMSGADIFVFPYREIQASGVFMLALRYGRPVVASNLGIFAEQIQDGVNGILVPPEDHLALARALENLSNNPELRASMGRANAEVACKFPSWNEIARATARVYEAAGRRQSNASN